MIPLLSRIHASQSVSQLWLALAAVGLLLCSCQFPKAIPEEELPPGPPHPRNQQPHALQNMQRLQGLLDQAVQQGEAGEAQADAFRKAGYPVISPSYQHPQHLHLVPSLKNQGLGPAPRY
jgi:hypothetical protein